MPLLRTVLFMAAALTTLYLLGFLFVLIGSPVRQFTDVLDLLRSVAMTTWVVWAVFFSAGKIMEMVRRRHMEEFADELGVRRQVRDDRRAAY